MTLILGVVRVSRIFMNITNIIFNPVMMVIVVIANTIGISVIRDITLMRVIRMSLFLSLFRIIMVTRVRY